MRCGTGRQADFRRRLPNDSGFAGSVPHRVGCSSLLFHRRSIFLSADGSGDRPRSSPHERPGSATMKGTNGHGSNRGFLKGFSVAVLAGAFVAGSGMPLMASPQQSGDSNAAAPQQPSAQQQTAQPQTSSLPDAPQAQAQTPTEQQQAPAPSGSAGAKAATVKGAPVAQPTGAAIAPAQQRGHHSLLVRVGLLAGAGIAVGTAVALAERSPSRPPGAR